jgi:anoctamin-10
MRALIFPSLLGLPFYFLKKPYSPLYTTLLLFWSITFVEWWTIRERILSVRWGTRGSAKVEKHRAGYVPGFPWWKRELRMVASVPVIMFFGVVLAGLLTAIFVFEAFVTQLYTGPGHKYIVSTSLPPFLTHIHNSNI